jgi:hypothetical protein
LLASRAAAQGERDGFFNLGCCFAYGHGCAKDFGKAKENFVAAAKLGDIASLGIWSELGDWDAEMVYWWGVSATRGKSEVVLDLLLDEVKRFNSTPSRAPIIFSFGRALRGHVNAENRVLFHSVFAYNFFDTYLQAANQAVDFFTRKNAVAARKAVLMWCLIARRVGGCALNKDIRKKIGMLIWEARAIDEYPDE